MSAKRSLFYVGLFIIGILLLPLSGCGGALSNNASPTPDAVLTQVAQQIEGLRDELARVAPTLTALVGAVSTQASLLVEQSTENQIADNSTATADAQATIVAAQQTPIPEQSSDTNPSPTGQNVQPFQIITPVPVIGGSLVMATPTPGSQTGDILFQDDFSSEIGWFTGDNDRYKLSFIDGQYSFDVQTKNNPIWSVKTKIFDDVRIEVDSAQIGGLNDGYFGLVCRYQDSENYYILVVSRNGNFGIGKVAHNQLRYLNFTNEYANLLKNTGNRLRADCVGNTLTLFVDGTQVLQATDDTFDTGGAGMVVGNRSAGGTRVRFDNFIVLRPASD